MGGLLPAPRRVQLSRAKGWRMPPNTVKVDRTTKWGNPFNLKHHSHCWTAVAHGFKGDPPGRHAASIAMFAAWVAQQAPAEVECGLFAQRKDEERVPIALAPEIKAPTPPTIAAILAELGGRNLACWCKPDQPCHADVLLKIANEASE